MRGCKNANDIRLFDTAKYSDLTITCHGRVFKVHRAVINPQSTFLTAAIDGESKVNSSPVLHPYYIWYADFDSQEAATGKIDPPDDDPKIIAHLIRFFYTGAFDDEPAANDPLADGRLTTCAKVYIIADKYDVPELKKLAATKFENAVSTDWNTESFSLSIELIYESLPDSDRVLKNIALIATSNHIKELSDRGEFVRMCKSDGEIAFDILNQSVLRLASGNVKGQCPYHKEAHRHHISWGVARQQFYCSGCGQYFH